MDRRCKIKWIRAAALTMTALSLGACGAPGGNTAATATAVAESSQPQGTPYDTPVPTTAPEETPLVAPTPEPTAPGIGQAICTAEEYVNIRAQASTTADKLGQLPAGETVGVISYDGDWAQIIYGDITGYVNREYIVGLHEPGIGVPSGDWALILVNKTSLLPDGFAASLTGFEGGQVDARIFDICTQMFADAEEDGVMLKLVDAYRSFETQSALFEEKVQSYIALGYSREEAEIKAATITARPNTSEHQTGLALDIVTPSYTRRNKGFAETKAFEWLDANAASYGFIMRYPDDKTDLTGVIYEPWHWRFVGVEAARAMEQSGECLEEYLGAI